MATFGPGDFFGELSLIDMGTRSASVIAQTPMRVLDLDRREFRPAPRDCPLRGPKDACNHGSPPSDS